VQDTGAANSVSVMYSTQMTQVDAMLVQPKRQLLCYIYVTPIKGSIGQEMLLHNSRQVLFKVVSNGIKHGWVVLLHTKYCKRVRRQWR